MKRRTFTTIALAATAGLALSACSGMSGKSSAPSIAGVVTSNSQFSTLTAAVTAADLAGTLDTGGPFTVFAPTDAAFAKLPAGTVETLLLPENKDALINVLTYHVLAGKVTSTDLMAGPQSGSVTMLNGDALRFDLSNGVTVGNATVTQPDIEASNGVIHVIDTVLLPPS